MPTKRRRRAPIQVGFTAEAIAAWKRGDASALADEIGMRPWEMNPLCAGDEPHELDLQDRHRLERWQQAHEVRRRLIEVAGQSGRSR